MILYTITNRDTDTVILSWAIVGYGRGSTVLRKTEVQAFLDALGWAS